MRLDRLTRAVGAVETIGDPTGVDVRDIVLDSREAAAGALFCCVRGAHADGHDFAVEAVRRGATAVLCERRLDVGAVQLVVGTGKVREVMAAMAAELHGHPDRHLDVVGVTGTNGKTTVTHMLAAILDAAGRDTAVLGTLDGRMTTEESPRLQAALGAERRRGRRAVAMEVSSHALAQHRVDAIVFAAAVFTNLSPEHLDYHESMDEYFRAKALLFLPERARLGVVNRDDEWGMRLLERARIPMVPYSLSDASDVEVGLLQAGFQWRKRRVTLPFGGDFNVMNALAAATVASELGAGLDAVVSGLETMAPVPGRMQPVDAGQPFNVLVDYAHTPAGLVDLLRAARRSAGSGRVIVAFGCGGQRDPSKRPLMGRAASELADVAVVTSDNPRAEDPLGIIDDVLSGVATGAEVVVEVDRSLAIGKALDLARPGDVVVVAGRGHETVQDLGERKVDLDDRVVVRAALEARAKAWT